MTREEACKLIDERMCFGRGKWSAHHQPVIDDYWEAGSMAIKALNEQPEFIEQLRLERDIAIQQLNKLGYGLGEKIRTDTDTISRQAAIDLVRDVCDAVMSGCESQYDPETEDEVYKDIREVDAILKCNKEVRIALRNMTSAQPEIVRCKYCKWYGKVDKMFYRKNTCTNPRVQMKPSPMDYCSEGRRRKE